MNSTLSENLRELDFSDEKILRTCLNEMVSKIKTDNFESMYEIVDALIEIDFPCARVIDHPIFIHIRNAFVDILSKPTNDFLLLRHIGQLFSRTANYIDDKNIHLFQQLFIDVTIIHCLSKQLRSISLTSHANLISGIQDMIDAYQKFQRGRPHIQNNSILSELITSVTNLVKSTEYKTSFFELSPEQDEITNFQKLILITCPRYIVSFWCKRQEEIAQALAEETLSRSSNILQHFLPFIDSWNEPIVYCMFYLIWLCQYSSDDRLLFEYRVEHAKILDCVLEMVQAEELLQLASQDPTSGKLQKPASQLICYATLYIYATSFLPELCQKLKTYNVTPILLKLKKVNYDKTQFHAYRILAVVLSDDDIKRLADPTQITAVFITYLKQSMNITSTRQRLTNLLLNLKSLIQHDQIKAEFVRQAEGLSFLIQCATEVEFDSAKVQLYALEIIMSLTFNDEANTCIQQNINFIQYIQTLVSTSSAPGLKKVANGILWRLFSKDEKTENKYQYDIMISYSHQDKDICYQIYQGLLADKFRVWIDLEEMHGAMIQAMAHAIEQSRYVLICMSNSYYLSPYCQAEAQYAFEKQRSLIPLRVQSGYKAEGWLAFITSGRLYIDFKKRDYNIAYDQLVSEVHQNQVDRKHCSMISKDSSMRERTPLVRRHGNKYVPENSSESSDFKYERTVSSYPPDVLQWTPAHVRDFLLDKRLDQMMPICQSMDGQILIELYKMCHLNSPFMLQTLRSEALDHSVQLSTNVYLSFLREMKDLIPKENVNQNISVIQNCSLS